MHLGKERREISTQRGRGAVISAGASFSGVGSVPLLCGSWLIFGVVDPTR